MRRAKAAFVLLLTLLCAGAQAGLDRYPDLLVADTTGSATGPPQQGVRVTHLGTNAYLLESRDTTLLIDPYYSRMSLFRMALNLRAKPQPALVARHLGRRRIDAILVTHGHCDHLLDVPEVMARSDARLIASQTSVQLVTSLGVPAGRCVAVRGGSVARVGSAKVHVFSVEHDRLLGAVPFDRPARKLPPRRVSDWVCGEPLAFLIEMSGLRIYVESGGQPGAAPPLRHRIDLAILGVALPDARARFPQTVAALRPRHVLPSHQDDFFRPLARGFVFGPLTDFPAVQRSFRALQVDSRLILLDYHRPWTLR